MDDLVVRPYRSGDRSRVREICHRTGFLGEPADWYWQDRDSFADVWTSWYTDYEPESAFVAEQGGRVVGYLLGCVDTRRAPASSSLLRRVMLRRLLPLCPGTARFFWRSVADLLRGVPMPSGELLDPRWPAHLHIDLLPEARRRGAGAALMRRWFGRLREVGSPGCHLGTLAENRNAIAFFQRMGFRRLGAPRPVPGLRSRDRARMHQQLMVRDGSP